MRNFNRQGAMKLAASGIVTYLDDNGVGRDLGFCRTWNSRRERFEASTDPEEEYAD